MAEEQALGLTGFRCRCGSTYRRVHRYPEKHGCGFYFKKAWREQIQRQKPVCRGIKFEALIGTIAIDIVMTVFAMIFWTPPSDVDQ